MSDLTKYLRDWDPKPQDGEARKNASGSDSSGQVDGENYDGNVPARWDMPISPEWGIGPEGNSGGFGHSRDCEVNPNGATAGMSQSDLERGYSKPAENSRYGDGRGQDVPPTNVHDRGAGSASRAAEFKSTEGRGFDGRGHDKSSPGEEQVGSSRFPEN